MAVIGVTESLPDSVFFILLGMLIAFFIFAIGIGRHLWNATRHIEQELTVHSYSDSEMHSSRSTDWSVSPRMSQGN